MPHGLALAPILQPSVWLFSYLFALGACLGSFVALLVDRLPRQENVVWPSSHCTACARVLRWYENLPVVSYVLQRGRCRGCGVRIGARALWLELAMGGLCVALATRLGVGWALLTWLPLTAVLLAIAMLDIDYFWVPDHLSYPGIAYAAACCFLPGGIGFAQAALGVLPALALWAFALLYARLAGKEGMGVGDIKLMVLIGLALGPKVALAVLVLASMQGAVLGIVLLAVARLRAAKPPLPVPAALADDDWQPPAGAMPFGPVLGLATLQMVLVPDLFLRLWAQSLAWLVSH